MLVIWAKHKSTEIQYLLRLKEGGWGMWDNKMALNDSIPTEA